ncbi:MAG: glycosyltransferase, partial [Caldilinea sp.]|nr:glycosyltransferase [Caldilinea sp.]
ILIVANLLLGTYYIVWRWGASINWSFWWIAVPLVIAETYSYLDSWLFGLTIWRSTPRTTSPPAPPAVTVDVLITCYNEPIEIVRETVRAVVAISYPHRTYIIDDGNSPAMRAMAEAEGVSYIVRTVEWQGMDRHAKSGNLNNALFQTTGEFLLTLDADQIPSPAILDRTLGYFSDPWVAFVQTPQWFYNVPPGDPFGSDAPLFYGPIQQGKDGWNAAFFCGSNAVLRRDALMQIGVKAYSRDLTKRVRRSLHTADLLLTQPPLLVDRSEQAVRAALLELRAAVKQVRHKLSAKESIQSITWEFQRRAQEVAQELVSHELMHIRAELADIPGIDLDHVESSFTKLLEDETALAQLASRTTSPLAAIETVRHLLMAIDVDRSDEAIPIMPFSTISVTEDMATAMRLHAAGWKSVYHHEVLARGLAPEDLRTAMQQRLRWAQGTIQVMLSESPLTQRGLSFGQRLMYFATMWSYFSGFFSVIYIAAPILYLGLGWLPVNAFSAELFRHLMPYLLINQLFFLVVGWGKKTWRGQQYSLALFPLWIRAVISAVNNVYRGKKLAFVVTPKTRQGGQHWDLVRPQIVAMLLLIGSSIYALVRLTLGLTDEGVSIVTNIFWVMYNLILLSAVLDAATYRPPEVTESGAAGQAVDTAALLRGRPG